MFLIKRDFLIVLGVFFALLLVFLLESVSADSEKASQRATSHGEAVYSRQPGFGDDRIPAY